MPGKRTPEIGELLDEVIVARQFRLEVAVRVKIDDHSQSLIEDHLNCGVEISQIIRRELSSACPARNMGCGLTLKRT